MFGQDNDKAQHDNTGLTPDPAAPYSLGAAPSDGSNPSPTHDEPAASAPEVSDSSAGSFIATDQSGAATETVASDDLLSIKQEALKQLSPLVSHLDQTPEEKFRTTMMMIQASDDQTLIKDAYAAAKEIRDEKSRAQALLDIINEINYFTAQNSGE